MPEEDDSLLEDREVYSDEKSSWPGRIRACVWCLVCLFFLAATILSLLALMKYFNRNSEEENPHDVESAKLGFPKNLSDFIAENKKLCSKISYKEKQPHEYSLNNIYIIKSEKNLTDEQACGIESILRLFPDKTIYLIDFNRHEDRTYVKCSATQNYLGLLLYLYKDRLQLLPVNKAEFFRNSPLESYPMAEGDFVFLVMVLAAYKYGGFVASPDTVMTSRELLECLPEDTIVDPVAIVTNRKCDDFLHYLMQSFYLCERDNSTLDALIDGAIKLYAHSHNGKAGVRRLSSSEVCHNVKKPCAFLRLPRFDREPTKWLGELSAYCKQVVQAFLGIKVNQLEVEEETIKMKNKISHSSRVCHERKDHEKKD